jgi:hypothetical protein
MMAEEDWEKELTLRAGEAKQDLLSVLAFLAGVVVQTSIGVNKIRYFRPKGSEENAARKSLAKLLRSDTPLEYQLRQTLAALFDVEADTYPGVDRQLTFQRRRSGRIRDHFRNSQIVEYIKAQYLKGCKRAEEDNARPTTRRSARQRKPRMTVDDAVQLASKKFALSERVENLGTL